MLGEGGTDPGSDTPGHLIGETLRAADLIPPDIGHINAHGTGTQQNDVAEIRGIRRAFGSDVHQLDQVHDRTPGQRLVLSSPFGFAAASTAIITPVKPVAMLSPAIGPTANPISERNSLREIARCLFGDQNVPPSDKFV